MRDLFSANPLSPLHPRRHHDIPAIQYTTPNHKIPPPPLLERKKKSVGPYQFRRRKKNKTYSRLVLLRSLLLLLPLAVL
jgi:hypothetical protein